MLRHGPDIPAEQQSEHRKDIIFRKGQYVIRPNPDGTYSSYGTV
jgi:hypothetical protein